MMPAIVPDVIFTPEMWKKINKLICGGAQRPHELIDSVPKVLKAPKEPSAKALVF